MKYKKFNIICKDKRKEFVIKKIFLKNNFNYTKKNPDFIVSHGGDGTFFYAEQHYPGIPKLLVKERDICEKCNQYKLLKIIKKLKQKKYKLKKQIKLEARIKTKNKPKKYKKTKLIAVNDIIVRQKIQHCCLRFNCFVNNKKINNKIIGDGVVVCTPYGSGAYFHSITRKRFDKETYKIGIAFNNSIEKIKPIVTNDKSIVKVKIIREDASISADNNPKMLLAKPGDVVEIRKSSKVTYILK